MKHHKKEVTMPRPYHGKPRSIKQRWVAERCWMNKGSLAGAAARLRMIAKDPSTLPDEASSIAQAVTRLESLLFTWDSKTRREISWEQFEIYHKP